MVRLALGVLIFCVVALNAAAQGAIHGIVVEDGSLKPLACVDVALTDSAGRVLERTQSSPTGEFRFGSALSASASLRFSGHGLTPSPFPVNAVAADAAGVRQYPIFLEPLATGAHPEDLGAAAAAPGFIPGSGYPRYPDDLRATRMTGRVVIAFMIDARGRPDTSTALVLEATHSAFRASVFSSLPNIRFRPGRRAGREACVFSLQEYRFDLARGPG
ncbi:MAG: energy transducer TonB [Gemmatimonadetes bacterium]|nr:energy transducer TonB [Gemmatimonadota bacterium]